MSVAVGTAGFVIPHAAEEIVAFVFWGETRRHGNS
jgi:hypothetical protein